MGIRGFDQWAKKGIYIPELNQSITPFYSVFVPSQREYINLFAQELKRNLSSLKKEDLTVLDIGMGILIVIS